MTKAAVSLDRQIVELVDEIIEPNFEDLTVITVNERRLKNKIENEIINRLADRVLASV